MKRLLPRSWRRTLRRLGSTGLLAITLLGAAMALTVWLVELQRHMDELAVALADRRQVAALRTVAAPTERSPAEKAAEVVAALPTMAQSSSDLEVVFALAEKRNLLLSKGEYRLKQDPNAAVLSYTVTFPIRSEYGGLKDFVADVMNALPHVSLEELRMSRADAGSVAIDSTVRLAFVYRNR